MNKLFAVLLPAVLLSAAALLMAAAADRPVRLHAGGADVARIKVKPGDRVVWSGNRWNVTFSGRSPCQNRKAKFASTESAANRVCVISATCTSADSSGCGVYKYSSAADGAPPVDPEVEVEPQN